MSKYRDKVMEQYKAALKHGTLAVHPDDLPEIEEYMTDRFEDWLQETLLKTIKYIKHHPESIKNFNKFHPFNDPQLKDIDWTRIKDAWFEGNLLKIEYEDN